MLAAITGILASADGESVDLSKGWTDVWVGLKGNGAFAGVMNLLTAVGAVIVVMAIAKLLWEKRRGGGGGGGMGGGKGSEGIMWALALGALLAAPNLILPVMLQILDIIANGVAGVFTNTQK